jgi:hypothetical protein
VSWSSLEPLDRTAIAVGLCLLLLVLGLSRAWILIHRLRSKTAGIGELAAALGLQIEDLKRRLARIEEMSQAHEADERGRHDEGVTELLGSLLQWNESLRGSPGADAHGRAAAGKTEAS